MSDETPDTPDLPAEPDRRDMRLAALLEVEPLDEVTRRRLVRTAVASAPARRPRLALIVPVAAAIVIGLIVGAVLVNRPDDPTPTAAPVTGEAPRAAGQPAQQPAGAPPVLGDLGDVTDPAALRLALARARSTESAEAAEPADKAATTSAGCATTPPPEAGAVVVTATGTADGTPVVIVVGTDPTGAEVAFVLRASDCAILERVPVVEG